MSAGITYRCSECGAKALGGSHADDHLYCPDHPKAIIDSISSRSGTRWTDADRANRGQKRLQVWLPEHLLVWLDEMAEHLGYSRTELLALVITCEHNDFKKSPDRWTRALEDR